MQIAGRNIGREHPPWVIAEMSGNHNGSLDRALALVEAAARAGAHALKLQTYTPDTMTIDVDEREFHIADPKSLWQGKSLYQLYGEAHTPWDWHRPLFERALALGVTPFSTPFDDTAVDFLESLDVPCYKIASFENTDLPLIRRAAGTGKPLILSTGMATLAELDESVRAARDAGCRELLLLKCTSTYPAPAESSNLRTIPDLKSRFDCEVGLSDHTLGLGVAVASVALGATAIEKHLTLSRADGGVDAAFSLEPNEFAALVAETGRAWQALGEVSYGPTQAERGSLTFRRSLYVVRDVAAGERFTRDNVRAIRPGLGLPPKHLEQVLGRVARRDIARGTALDWEMLG
jgi:pseudaminic acid synthase